VDGADFLIIGGGIAGLSAAARLGRHGRTIVLEAEDAPGYHSSGRSVSYSHFGIGNAAVRGLTAYSRTFFEAPPEGICETPLCRVAPSLWFAREGQQEALAALQAAMAGFTDAIEEIGAEEIARRCPVVRTGPGAALHGLLDPYALKLDGDILLQSFVRMVRGTRGTILTGRRIAAIERRGDRWRVGTETGETFEAPILIDAAGAWADGVARLGQVRPLGLRPKRRTIIAVDPPPGVDPSGWPFVHSIAGDFYMLPEAGRILASPADEVDDDPCDAQPEDYDLALAADRLGHYTTVPVARIAHRWAGLRTFAADRVPTAGFAPDAPGFFLLAGQGGYGLQTAPAMAEAVEALAMDTPWPQGLAALGVMPETIRPERLLDA